MKELFNKIVLAWQWTVAIVAAAVMISIPVAVIAVIVATFIGH